MLDKIYHWILYNLGFINGEHFSDMLARQRIRWGDATWLSVVFVTIALILGVICYYVWRLVDAVKSKKRYAVLTVILVVLLIVLGFCFWLFTHIRNFIPRKWVEVQ